MTSESVTRNEVRRSQYFLLKSFMNSSSRCLVSSGRSVDAAKAVAVGTDAVAVGDRRFAYEGAGAEGSSSVKLIIEDAGVA